MSKTSVVRRKALASILTPILLLSYGAFLFVLPASAQSSWSMPRPSEPTDYYETIGNADSDDTASIGMGVDIFHYHESGDPNDDDYLRFRVSMFANTREGIQYTVGSPNYNWHTVTNLADITADDGGVWLDLPFPVLFYGVDYARVWVCSNGFLSFNSSVTNPTPASIPNVNQPNATVAPFWRDLNLAAGGSITYGYIGSSTYGSLFVVSWNGIPNKINGVPQTFQAVICRSVSGGYGWYHNRIIFQYASITRDDATTVGIEDAVGTKGTSYDYNQLTNNMALMFAYDSMGYRLEQLKMTLTKSYSDSNAMINFLRTYIGGCNVQLNNPADGGRDFYVSAIEFGAGLLVSGLGGATAGVVFSGLVVVGHGASALLSHELSEPIYQVQDASETVNEAFIISPGQSEQYFLIGQNPFDSTLAATVEWSFLDPNLEDHGLTITAEATYKEVGETTPYTITTSTTLAMYHQHQLTITSGSGGTTNPPPGTHLYNQGSQVTVAAIPNQDYALSYWLLDGQEHSKSENPISFTMDSDHTLYASWEWTGHGPVGGCPYVSTWNGSHYLQDNNLIPAAEYSNGTDITDYYLLQQPMTRIEGKYQMLIWDIDKHSFIDHAQLVAVDHESDVKIGVSPDGQILTYKNPVPPTTATSKNGSNILALLNQNDGEYYQGYQGDYIELDFAGVDILEGAKLVVRSDWCLIPPCTVMKSPTYIQVLNSTGDWHTVATIYPRIFWSNDIIDLSEHLPDVNGELRVRISFTSKDKIDYVGLDATKQGEFELSYASLVTASHTRLGDVKSLLRTSDNMYVELSPGEQFTLQFALPQNTEEKRDFIVILEGHYFLQG